MPGWSA
ncbi:hypothetical protein AAY473_012406 [Plecturocebus cupreus]